MRSTLHAAQQLYSRFSALLAAGLHPCAASSAYALIRAMATEDIRNRKIAPSITFKFLVQQSVFGCKDCASRVQWNLFQLPRRSQFSHPYHQVSGANIQQGVSQRSGHPKMIYTILRFPSCFFIVFHISFPHSAHALALCPRSGLCSQQSCSLVPSQCIID